MEATQEKISEPSTNRRFQLRFLIVAAAIWHVSVAITVFAVGRYQLFPSQIYPTGIGRFALDGVAYQDQIPELGNILKNDGLAAWFIWPNQIHVRLYSLPPAAISHWFAFNILTIEPLNLLYYLAILILIYKLGEAIFDHQSGLIAAAIIGLWPSFLLHTTQLLRDPLLISAVLILVLGIVESLRREWRLSRGFLYGAMVAMSIVVIRVVRLPMWYVVCAAVGLGFLLLAVRAWHKKRVGVGTAAFALLIVVATVLTPRFQPFFHNQQESGARNSVIHEEVYKLPIEDQIVTTRMGFSVRIDERGNIFPAEDASRIDGDLKLNGLGDIIRHLPRAIAIGFFAPFPDMWLQAGRQVGAFGRVISGFETLLTYVIEFFALLGLWRARETLTAWFLVIFVTMGAVALGLAVNNIGALYRLRYPFWVLMVVLAAGGVSHLSRHTISKLKLKSA
jgi:putative peptidoglycan lipid II flippase